MDGGSVARGIADLGATARVCRTWAALIAEEDCAGWLILLASLHRQCRLPLKLPWKRVIAADTDGRARRYRSMLRRVRADALLLLIPAGRDHLVRVRLDRALKSPTDRASIYLKVHDVPVCSNASHGCAAIPPSPDALPPDSCSFPADHECTPS